MTRQSVGISNFYKVNMEDLNLQKNIIYFFNFIFFVVGYLRFYIQIIEETIVLNTTIIMLICLSLIYYFSKIRNLKNFFTLISGIIIFYPICFVDNPIHAILMGVTIHYSQYLIFSFKVQKEETLKKSKYTNKFYNYINFLLYCYDGFYLIK